MYRIVLACTGIPAHEGPTGAESIKKEFTHRPWHSNVKCEWDGAQLILQADNDYDSGGQALMDEFSDAISACISNAGDGGIKVLSVICSARQVQPVERCSVKEGSVRKGLNWMVVTVASLLLSGCSPVKSLFPLYTDADQLFDGNLIGEWRATPEQSQKDAGSNFTDNKRWIFQKTQDHLSYDCSQVELGKHGAILSTARLVKLGDALFVDFGPGPAFPEGPQDISYPSVDAHAVGRIRVDKDEIKIRFLDAKWVWKQIHADKFPLAYVDVPTDLVLTASTEQLRKFASEHADDKEAFSVEFRLVRMK